MAERRTFTVIGRGVGRPDYTPEVAVGRPIIGKLQEKFSLLWTPNVPAGEVAVGELYTVPEGYRLNLGGAVITCEASCIQMVRLCHTPGIIGDYRYDVKGEIMFTPLSSTAFEAGDICIVFVFNNDEVARNFSVTIVGVVEQITGI